MELIEVLVIISLVLNMLAICGFVYLHSRIREIEILTDPEYIAQQVIKTKIPVFGLPPQFGSNSVKPIKNPLTG